MSPIGDSEIRMAPKGNGCSPFKSRSTIICLACIGALLCICFMAVRSGFFTAEFALTSVVMLKGIADTALGHQKAADPAGGKPA